MRCSVYKCYNGDELLYIGKSSKPDRRMAQHRSTSSWCRKGTRVDISWFDCEAEASANEAKEIRRCRPKHNYQHNREPFVLINIKVDPDDADKWREAAREDGRTVSEICRAALERVARRVEKQRVNQ